MISLERECCSQDSYIKLTKEIISLCSTLKTTLPSYYFSNSMRASKQCCRILAFSKAVKTMNAHCIRLEQIKYVALSLNEQKTHNIFHCIIYNYCFSKRYLHFRGPMSMISPISSLGNRVLQININTSLINKYNLAKEHCGKMRKMLLQPGCGTLIPFQPFKSANF